MSNPRKVSKDFRRFEIDIGDFADIRTFLSFNLFILMVKVRD
jgi:hypothetical protein